MLRAVDYLRRRHHAEATLHFIQGDKCEVTFDRPLPTGIDGLLRLEPAAGENEFGRDGYLVPVTKEIIGPGCA